MGTFHVPEASLPISGQNIRRGGAREILASFFCLKRMCGMQTSLWLLGGLTLFWLCGTLFAATRKKASKNADPAITIGPAKQLNLDDLDRLVEQEKQEKAALHAKRPYCVVIIIPMAVWPMERYERFEEPIEAALNGKGLVDGGGTMSVQDKDGTQTVKEVDIVVYVENFQTALPILKRVLRRQGAPPATEIRLTEPQEKSYRLGKG